MTTGNLSQHRGFSRVFRPERLTMGFILPVEGYPNSATPTLRDHQALTRRADELGFAALWARDVPLLDPMFGDAGQMLDPFVYLGYLASNTRQIALGTASTVLTLRHPLHVAKQASSVDFLSDGRLLLGVSSGDRPVEYPAFNIDYESRGERFREALGVFRLATEEHFPSYSAPTFGRMDGRIDMLPKPVHGRIPAIVTGRSRQDMEWIAAHSDGWLYYALDLEQLATVTKMWRRTVQAVTGSDVFKPFAMGFFLDLASDPDHPAQRIHSGWRAGRNALIEHMQTLQQLGVNHVAFNLKSSRRAGTDVLEELAEYVLPHFPAQAAVAVH